MRTGAVGGATALLALLAVGGTPAAAAAPGWEPPRLLSEPGASAAAAAGNARGDLAVAWVRRRPAGTVVEMRVRPAGAAAWSPALRVAARGRVTRGPRLALAADGRVLAAWLARPRGARGFSVEAALAAPNLAHVSVTRLARAGPALRDPSPPAVAVSTTGRAVVAWAAPVRRPGGGAATVGRVRVATAAAGRAWTRSRAMPRPAAVGIPCVDERDPRLAPRPAGGLLAWWDCHDAVRDAAAVATFGDSRGRFPGPVQGIGAVSRAPTGAVLAPLPGGGVTGLVRIFEDSDQGGTLRGVRRTTTGAWRVEPIPLAPPEPPDPGAPYADAAPALAVSPAHRVALWHAREFDPLPTIWSASGGAGGLGPAAPLAVAGGRVALAGVALATDGGAVGAWAETGAEASRILLTRRRGAGAPFGPPELLASTARREAPPQLAGAGARAVVAWAEGPAGRARVRAAAGDIP